MNHVTRTRFFSVGAAAAACLASSACPSPNLIADDPQHVAVADSITTVFQMTGLMLLVPPGPRSTGAYLLMPRDTGTPHLTRFVFGAETAADACTEYDDGICWVDLESWEIEPISGAGMPTPFGGANLPPGMMNLSTALDGKHHVHVPPDSRRVQAHVKFQTGRVEGDTCVLARWRYQPLGEDAERPTSLYNVLSWVVRTGPRTPLKIRFIPRPGGPTLPPNAKAHTATLVVSPSGTTYTLIAHVTQSELEDMQAQTYRRTEPPAVLSHTRQLYALLGHETTGAPPREPLPLPALEDTTRVRHCQVTITRRAPRGHWLFAFDAGLSTYSCVLATADRRP